MNFSIWFFKVDLSAAQILFKYNALTYMQMTCQHDKIFYPYRVLFENTMFNYLFYNSINFSCEVPNNDCGILMCPNMIYFL